MLDYARWIRFLVNQSGLVIKIVSGWRDISELASVLNASFGSTRPVVDAGWSDFDSIIGQSGKMVNSELCASPG